MSFLFNSVTLLLLVTILRSFSQIQGLLTCFLDKMKKENCSRHVNEYSNYSKQFKTRTRSSENIQL